MLNLPLSTTEKAKVILYFISLLATFIFAIIPVAVITLTMNRAKRYQNFAPLDSARVILSIYYTVVMIGFAVGGVLNTIYVNGDEATALFTLSFIGALMIAATNLLFFNILKAHQNWVVEYGIFVDRLDIDPNETLPMDGEIVEQ